MPLEESEFNFYLEKQTLKDIEVRTLNGTYIYFSAWLLIGGGTGFYVENALFYWSLAGLFLLIGVIRLVAYRHFSRSASINNAALVKWHYFNLLAPSLVFSVLLSLAFYAPEFEVLFIYLLMAIFAFLSAGTVNFAPVLKMSFIFVLGLTILPFFTAMFLADSRFQEGLMLLLYGAYMLIQANRLNKEYIFNLKQQFQLNRLSLQDGLTGIANRRCFDQALTNLWKNALRSHKHLTLILIDIDLFKRVNDQFGHSAGDAVIKGVAEAIQSVCMRDTDIVARIGGEEYAVLLNSCDPEMIQSLAERIRVAIEMQVVTFDGNEISVTASIGVAFTKPNKQQSTVEFYKIADQSMYAAKKSGRNLVKINDYKPENIASVNAN